MSLSLITLFLSKITITLSSWCRGGQSSIGYRVNVNDEPKLRTNIDLEKPGITGFSSEYSSFL